MKLHSTIEKEGLRWYIHLKQPSLLFPSVSTIVGWEDKLFGKFKNVKTGNMANCGSGIHFQIQKYILDEYGVGDPTDTEFPNINIWGMLEKDRRDKLNGSMRMWFRFLRDNPDYEPLAQELALFYDVNNLRFAGRIDQLINLGGQRTLLDIKTGGYWESYDYQLAGYFILLQQIEKVDRVVALYLDANPDRNVSKTYKLHEYTIDQIIDNSIAFMEMVKKYYENKTMILEMVFEE